MSIQVQSIAKAAYAEVVYLELVSMVDDLLGIVDGLSMQQAMPDDGYVEPTQKIERRISIIKRMAKELQ